ncbi:MAG: hypothetical protein HQK89_10605 [Nitrospirae bacterium]|nr:hypothetical protein [Nitrospirota bacterium]
MIAKRLINVRLTVGERLTDKTLDCPKTPKTPQPPKTINQAMGAMSLPLILALLLLAAVVILSSPASIRAAERAQRHAQFIDAIVLSGTQIRATMNSRGRIASVAVTLKHPVTVIRVDGGKDGFCITGSAIICSSEELIGTTLAPGTYKVFPNVPEGKEVGKVTIYLR